MNLKSCLVSLGFIVFPLVDVSAQQVLPWPIDPYGIEYRVDSAYGPRDLGVDADGNPITVGTFFHKGIDLNAKDLSGDLDINYPVTAAGFGTIFGIGKTGSGIKWIGVNYGGGRNFAYLHIFPHKDIESGNFVGVGQTAPIRSYKRIYTEGIVNRGVVLLYSGLNQTGRIVQALGIDGIHTDLQIKVPESEAGKDDQIVPVGTQTPDENTIVVSCGTDGVLNTLKQGDDGYDGNNITAGPNKIAESRAGYIVPQTAVGPGEIIAPLGKSGTNNAHLHLQVSSPDLTLYNGKQPGNPLFNDGWNNVVQYLARGHSQFSGEVSTPTEESILYHTMDHNNERVKASIRWRPEVVEGPAGPEVVNWKTYHSYELDRLRLMAIPEAVLPNLTPADAAANTYLINGNRDVQTTFADQLPDPADPFRAEFDYGGTVGGSPLFEEDNAFPPFINNTGNDYRSDGTRTGLNPLGSLSTTPRTEFVFNQWNTRIRKDFAGEIPPVLANLNEDAAYPDGRYGLVAVAESMDREESERFISAPTMVTLDNFRPYVKQVEVKQSTTTFYKRSWELDDKSMLRSYAPSVEEPIVPGEYTVITTFSEPMFEASLVNINNAFTPFTSVQVSTLAIGNYYLQDAMLPLEIRGADIAGTSNELFKIDPDKSYIDPARELTRDASGYMPAGGGSDKFHSLRVEAGFPPSIGYEDRNHILAYGCGGDTCGTEAEPIDLAWNRVRFSYRDIGSGIKEITIRNVADNTVVRKFSYAPHVYNQEIELNLEDGLYEQTVWDNKGNFTTMWFRVDPESPRLNIGGVDMDVAAGTYTIHGTVQDTNSGMDFFHLDGGGLHHDFAPMPGSRELIPFTSPELNVESGSYYVFSAQDKARNGSPQPIFEFIKTAAGGEVAPGQTNLVANYISEVTASGEPCAITITSARNTFTVPIEDGLPDGVSISAALTSASLTPQVVATPGIWLHGNVSVSVTPKICNIINGENICNDACTVSLAGQSIASLANGPAEAFVRNSSATTAGVKFGFEGSIITFYNLNAGPGSKLTMESVPSPAAPKNYVVYPPGLNRSLHIKYDGALYSGIKIKTCGMLPSEAVQLGIRHYLDNGTQEDLRLVGTADEEYALDLADADHCVTRLSGSNSLFSLVAPLSMYDNAGPVVIFKVENTFEKDGAVYISSSSPVELTAEDRSSNTFALAGAASTYYQLDAEPAPKIYDGPFPLGEGAHAIHYYAIDKIDNLGETNFAQLRVDSTPPESALELNGLPIAPSATVYATTADFITLVATDTISNGVMSGLATTYFLVGVSPEDCEYSEWASGGINGMGSCENSFYSGPFNLPVGGYTIYYQSVDNVRNAETGKAIYIEVKPPVQLTSLTLNPPLVFLEPGSSQQFTAQGSFSDGTTRTIIASDGALWSVDHSTVAAADQNGLITGLGYGRTQVRVSLGGFSASAGLFIYTPVPASFSSTGDMTEPRHLHTATMLSDGTVLIAGGNGSSGILSSAELYNPLTGVFTVTGSMSEPRGRTHAATLLSDGRVLLTGGINNSAVITLAELYNPGSGKFSVTGPLATGRYAHTATLLSDGRVLIAGGSDENGPVSSAELYDPVADTFSPAGKMTSPRYLHSAELLPDGKVLIVGGFGNGVPLATAEIYDPLNNSFAPTTGQMKRARKFVETASLADGKVLVIGGYDGSATVLVSEVYDPVTGTFTDSGLTNVGRSVGHTTTLLPNGEVLVAGGNEYADGGTISSAEVYDPASKTFSLTVPMNQSRRYHAAALLLPGGKVLVCGGSDGSSSSSSAELYNFGFASPSLLESMTVNPSSATVEPGGTRQYAATGYFSDGTNRVLGVSDGLTWSVVPATVAYITTDGLATGVSFGQARITVSSGSLSADAALTVAALPFVPRFIATGPMTEPRHLHTATLLPDGMALIAGGNGDSGILSSAELYNPLTGVFTVTGSMSEPRGRTHAATLLSDGRVLLTGGINGSAVITLAELYDPSTFGFSKTGPMAVGRYAHTSTLLPDGRVLIAGGSDENGPVSSAELYDPVAGTFSPAGEMTSPRYLHSAELLPDGKVLIVGGFGNGVPLATAEIYDPLNNSFAPTTGQMKRARKFVETVSLADGKVLVIGGYDGSVAVFVAEVYDPVTGTFTDVGSTNAGRLVGHVAVSLPDGNVLVAGGDEYASGSTLSSAELYDPADEAFYITASMSQSRRYHAAALLLPGGKVLVCGGSDGSSSSLSAELYDSGFRGALSPALTSIVIAPSTATVEEGKTQQFTVSANYSNASKRALDASDGLAWSVAYDTVAAISPDGGLATGSGYGKTRVKVRYGIFSAEALLEVTPVPVPSDDGLLIVTAPGADLTVTTLSTETISSTTPVFAAMTDAGLSPVSSAFYELLPSGVVFTEPAKLKFTFDPAEIDTNTVAIYYFDTVTVAWTSASIYNQQVTFNADGSATLEGEIYHTSLYALLRASPAPAYSISLDVKPEVLNLKSEGESITAELRIDPASAGCFKRETINISAINGQPLANPLFAQEKKEKEHKKYSIECGSITVKFDREKVMPLLPENAVVKITVSGVLADGKKFSAEGTIRTIRPQKISRRGGGHGEHHKHAAFDAPAGSVKDDCELYVLSIDGDRTENEARKERAAKAGRLGRRGSAYEFGPEGSKFDKPLTISLPYDVAEKSPEKLAIAYWNETSGAWELLPSRRDASAKLVKADVPHFSQYQVVAASYAVSVTEQVKRTRVSDEGGVFASAADPEFRLGEVYVFPNPAKGSEAPTFHIETGLADSVKITIYTVSGRAAHEYTLTGMPAELDDGNGLSYAYEYTWRGHIPTGVYLYYIEAQKAGQKLKKTGKFAVVR